MPSLFSRFVLALSIIRIVVAVPLGIEYDKTTGLTPEELANKGRLDTAAALAHTQVGKMREGLDKVKNGDPRATALYHAAFGTQANIGVVDNTVTALEHGNIQAKLATHPFTQGEIAAVPWSKDGKKPWTPGPAQFSDQFHGGTAHPLDDAGRAGTLIHEATHQLAKTGDDINKSGKIIKPYDGTSKPTGDTGYTSNHNMHKTVAEVNADHAFTDVRDSAPNMHENAESYAVFASLCSQPGALRRRDVRLYNRALLAGDHDQLHYLARRNSCQLPPDYFAKKAAAKKAAAAKAALGGVKPAPNSKVAATNGINHSTKDSKSAVQPTSKALHGVNTATKGASAARLTKVTTSKSLNGAKTSNRLATEDGARSAIKGAKVPTAAREPTKGANAGRLLKTTTAKGSKTALKANKQTAKGISRTVKGTKALTPGSRAAKSNKQRTHAFKLPKVNSHTKATPRRGSSKTAALRGSKAMQSKSQRKIAGTHPVKSSHTNAASRKNSSKVGTTHAVRPVGPVGHSVKPLAPKVAVTAKSRKH